MKTNYLHRILSILLVMCMVFSGLSLEVFATDNAWQIMDGNFGAGTKVDGVDLTINDAPTTNSTELGKVKTSKSIAPTNEENIFNITLQVETEQEFGEDIEDPAAAVALIIDISASMKDETESITICSTCKGEHVEKKTRKVNKKNETYYVCSDCNKEVKTETKTTVTSPRISAAKDAAIEFINSLVANAPEGAERWVCLIPFGTKVKTKNSNNEDYDWVDVNTTEGYNKITTDINNLKTDTYTNLSDALLHADTKIKEKSSVANKFVVALTDGAPTSINDGETTSKNKIDGKYVATLEIANETAESAKTITDKKIPLYTICFDTANDPCYEKTVNNQTKVVTVGEFLTSIATNNFYASEGAQISTSFQSISHLIALLTEAWTVTDPMGEHIIYKGLVSKNKGTCVTAPTIENNQTLSWDLKSDASVVSKKVNNVETFTYTLTYQVQLDTEAEEFEEDIYYPTNGYTSLSYVFYNEELKITDEEGNVLENQETTTSNILPFTVPGVKGNIPEYNLIVEFYKENKDGIFELQEDDTLEYKNLDRWTTIDTSYAKEFENKYNEFEYLENNTRVVDATNNLVTDWRVVEDNMKLQLFYSPADTSVIVNYFVRTDIIDNTTGEIVKGDYNLDSAASYKLDNLKATYEYVAEDLTTTGLTKVVKGTNDNGKEEFTGNSITLSADATKNVINLYYKTVDDDQRSEATVEFYHIYKDYEWQLNKDGKYEEILVKDTTTTPTLKSEATARIPKHDFSYKYNLEDEYLNETYKYVKTDFAANTKDIAFTKENTITVSPVKEDIYKAILTYEHHDTKPEDVTVYVYHEYITQTETIVEKDGEYVMEVITTGEDKYEHSSDDEYIVADGETVVVDEVAKDFESSKENEAKLIHKNSKDGDEIYLQYYKYIPIDTAVVNTISYFRTWESEVDTTTGAIKWNLISEDYVDEKSYPANNEKLYIGQSFTVNPNPENRTGYIMDGMETESGDISDNVRIDHIEKTNTLIFYYDKYEDIEVASVQVVHKYYKHVQTINGIGTELIPICEDNEVAEEILFNEIGKTEEFTPVYTFNGYDDFELEPSNQVTSVEYTCLGKNGEAGTVITLIYSRISDERIATDLTVHHEYYSKEMTVIDGVAKYPETYSLDSEHYSEFEVEEYKNETLYEGMTVTVDSEDNGYRASDNNKYIKVLGIKGTNIIELDYFKEIPLDKVNVEVTHTYKLYTYSYDENGKEIVDIKTTYGKTVNAEKYEGERYDAEEVLVDNYELESCEYNGTDVINLVIDGIYNIDSIKDDDKVDYIYVAYEGKREAAEVKVYHYYTTIDDYDNSIIDGYDKSTGNDVTTSEVYIPVGPEEYSSYVGLNFTATADCKPLDGIDSYKVVDVTPEITIEVVNGENIIRIYYERHICSHKKVEVIENHIYYVYDKCTGETTLVDRYSTTTENLWDDEEFTATVNEKDDFELQTAEENLTITLSSDESLNVINVEYLKVIDSTPTIDPEPVKPHRPHRDEPKEEPEIIEEEIIEENIEEEIVPLSEFPFEIEEEIIPLAAMPEFEIFEEEIPLANVPMTGDNSYVHIIVCLTSLLALVVLFLFKKKEIE